MPGVDDAKLIELPRIGSPRGNLTFLEGKRHIPFEIQRVFFLYDVPGGESRAGHANRTLEEFLIAASGSFDVTVDDGNEHRTFFLNRSYYGLYIPPMLWREINNFSSGSVCLVIASDYYDAKDYHRSYTDYRTAMAGSSAQLPHPRPDSDLQHRGVAGLKISSTIARHSDSIGEVPKNLPKQCSDELRSAQNQEPDVRVAIALNFPLSRRPGTWIPEVDQ